MVSDGGLQQGQVEVPKIETSAWVKVIALGQVNVVDPLVPVEDEENRNEKER